MSPRVRAILSRAPAALFLLLWFGATFYFLGNTGKHSDDYAIAMRNRVTGEFDLHLNPWSKHWAYFWRPLHLAHCSTMNAISWNHPWIGHLELAIVHGCVALMLAGLLTRLGIRRPIACVAALLFMVCPLDAEAALWTSTSCNAISTLFLLYTLELARRQAIGPESLARTLCIGLLAFITACWYEPAAAAMAAIPFVCFAASKGPWRGGARFVVILRSTAAAGFGCFLYAALLIGTAPAKSRGGAQSIISLHEVLPSAHAFVIGAFHAICGERARQILLGSYREGTLVLHSPHGIALSILATILAMLAAAALALGINRPRPTHPPQQPIASATRGGILLIGAAVFVASWIPVMAVRFQGIELRTLYVPLLGLAIIAAGLANGAANLLARAPSVPRKVIGALAATLALAAALAGTAGMIGFQSEFRLNYQHDRGAAEQLRSLIPNPPPDTTFLPLRVDAHGAATGLPKFDYAIHGAFDRHWSARPIITWIYRRNDLTATATSWWYKNLEPRGFTYTPDSFFIPWDVCVPFIVDASGNIHLVRRLSVIPSDGEPFTVDFPRIPPGVPADDTGAIRLVEFRHIHSVTETPAEPRP